MDFKQIRTFVTLAECLHFGQAAEHLSIAQPHVSRRIKQLEEELGVQLFYRDKRNVRLTEAGGVFLGEAHAMLRQAENARERTQESARGRRGLLNISLVTSAMLGILPTILGEFRRQFPDIHLTFKELGTALQLESLAQGSTDIAIIQPPMRTPDAYDHITLEREPLLAVLPRGHRLAGEAQIGLFDLAGDPWIMFPRDQSTPIHDRIIALCQKAGFSPRIVQEAGPVPFRLALVAAGFGVHVLHRSWETMPYPGIAYVPVRPTAIIAHAGYWRRGDPNPILRSFLEIARRHRVTR
jgi:DNA-binding transcriptional LysR family regulator